ncbi:hypothetical protein AVEN_51431-1 [Araneus ventricosus]|uniref:Uncharacterized protein n=1 Tax=Araneus ventricosus TaxID=182803 RepID=A0A4Y2W3T3_ARAVE|nr:hypothetical protein AVEN_51431-1 [Araneus ventricosus]
MLLDAITVSVVPDDMVPPEELAVLALVLPPRYRLFSMNINMNVRYRIYRRLGTNPCALASQVRFCGNNHNLGNYLPISELQNRLKWLRARQTAPRTSPKRSKCARLRLGFPAGDN